MAEQYVDESAPAAARRIAQGWCGRHREPLGHHVPGAQPAAAEGHRRHHVRGNRRRPGAGYQLHRLPPRSGRPRDQGRDDDRRDRWFGQGRGGRLHQVVDVEAGVVGHRRCDRTSPARRWAPGAIVSGGKGTAAAKMEAAARAGVEGASTPPRPATHGRHRFKAVGVSKL